MICVKIKAFLCFLKLVQLGPKKKEKYENKLINYPTTPIFLQTANISTPH